MADSEGKAAGFYCAGCNERFVTAEVPAVCPRCQAVVPPEPETALSETLLLRDSSPPGRGRTAGELDALVGGRLAVYDVKALLGSGGMGRVYLAHHADLHRNCALKVLSPKAVARDVDYVERFYHEGRAAAALVHPNVITTHAIGGVQGLHFLEMEFVPGRSLQQVVQDEGWLPPIRATALTVQIAEGLAAAHRERIIHRDLKPDNVLLTQRGVPKIADFGLAKRVFWDDGIRSDHLVGTPNYMAPELFAGEPASPASDVYALGVTYFLLLAGRLPYAKTTLSALIRSATEEPLPEVREEFPDVSLEMAECLSLLTAKCPGNRPRDGIEAAQLLHAVWGKVPDIEALLLEAFADEPGVAWTRTGQQYEVKVRLADGRRQTLYVEPSEHAAAERLLMIYSLCCPAHPDHYEYALRLNAEVSHGGISIRDVEGQSYFCMVDTYPRATVDALEVRRSVLEIAHRADSVERRLTGGDCH